MTSSDHTTGRTPRPAARPDTGWMATAVCRDYPTSMFFPTDLLGVERAKKLCHRCPVRAECLEYALRFSVQHGVWGGASERARRRMTRVRSSEGEDRRLQPASPIRSAPGR